MPGLGGLPIKETPSGLLPAGVKEASCEAYHLVDDPLIIPLL